MEQEILQKLNSIEGLVQDFMAVTANNFTALSNDLEDFKDDTKINFKKVDDKFEIVESRLDGLQRAVDAGFERTGSLEARVSKIEAEM